jgi:hypothetical protein
MGQAGLGESQATEQDAEEKGDASDQRFKKASGTRC